MRNELIELMKKASLSKQQGFLSHYREAFKNASGMVSIGQIAAECIAVLVLVCIMTLVPMVASSVQDNLPAISNTSAWNSSVNAGADVWGTAVPLLNVACLICIIGLVLHVIVSLKHRD